MNRFVFHAGKIFLSVFPKGMRFARSLRTEKIKIPRARGSFNAYLIRPKALPQDAQTIFYFHGGAFVFRGAPYHYKLAQIYAERARANVIFIEYSLAFEKRGDPLRDCVEAYRFILARKEELGVGGRAICFAGDSAGAYLSLALFETCRETVLPLPQKMMLVYPVIAPDTPSQSMEEFIDTPMWNSRLNGKMWELYGGKNVFDPFKMDLGGFPETYIETAEFDCLHDEGVLFAEALKKAGVKRSLNQTSGTMHGYDIRLSAPTTQQSIEKRVEFLKQS